MVEIRADLLPDDGRFGSGPSKVRIAQVESLKTAPFGTSHRQQPVKMLVGEIRSALSELFALPDGYEVLLGNGGASALWDAIPFNLVNSHAHAAVIGEFSGKAARALQRAPWLKETDVLETAPGSVVVNQEAEHIDSYLYAHNETSTGAMSPLARYGNENALTIVDGTSIAGGALFDAAAVDFYYFSPQKCFGADGGLWFAFASPAAIERIERHCTERWVPDFLNLSMALDNSRKDQTLNTPAISTLALMQNQLAWMLDQGGIAAMAQRCRNSSGYLYKWAEENPLANPYIREEKYRSPVVVTIDFDDSVDTKKISAKLREHGIVDIDPYRSLGRNQFRIATFPSVEKSDIEALVACLELLINN
ncbi:phosphoserine aminotransferase [Arcanobacterium pluranimalium]|uniref:phosphoserine transaminase n=1 Tax=Arcanobacterium pluranimalium TaxID=108028 RepID=UPI00195898E1|nr:phosphoserine transaminase [Arcanobacterium pluranimalium]MBM7824651.1 phosphoserine aminotransferase [Arcanobacterium pluranimalium]